MSAEQIFDGWGGIVRIAVVGVCAYVALVAMLRVSGKRTLSKMNAFDLVVTVALGSTLATVLLDRQTPLVNGVFALGLLVGLQYVITWLSVRSPGFQGIIKSRATTLVSHGRFIEEAMVRQRVTRDEIMAALRQHGHDAIAPSLSVVLETDGSLSVTRSGEPGKNDPAGAAT